ncbi:alkaline phosphatase family protein [Modestobacter muralis]|uniref:Alkaline phosphatase family protein n=1 Tax=Modestobacter muralis TaxID=1608614 RepID=A0A6P0EWT2_9ACTN|nr:nucleotide pyrophosphatase/phosphodiesterase family protein [Modestobacter muralis]NEK95380.1 alkaline phosphatase family protein [Modestobacter muralis]NEN52268.1 alkaline phosphatase family protein [Modestobacter muralis]
MTQLPQVPLSRRRFLAAGAATGAAVVLSAAAGAPDARAAGPGPRVYVLVVDGCRPDEISPVLTPRLAALRSAGTTFPLARSLPVMETIPNHTMMMTGVRPDRTGVPSNSVFDRVEGVVRDLDRPGDLRFPTLLERLRTGARTTGSVLSKEYLFGVFGTRATYRWEPFPLLPVTDHAPDAATTDALIAMVDGPDPDFVFTNLGDVDRFGHADVTGTTVQAARRLALASTDLQVGRFVDHLRATGRWERSVLLVLADHSMDFSLPTSTISVNRVLAPRPDLQASITIAQNGGADLLYWTGPPARRKAGLTEVRRLVQAHPGVLSVHVPGSLRLGPEAGDLLAYARPGWRFTDPEPTSNPIPGNHGHPATEPIPFFLSGGHPALRQGLSSSAQARTVDVAPTVGAVFGLTAPTGGYDGAPRREAFVALPLR